MRDQLFFNNVVLHTIERVDEPCQETMHQNSLASCKMELWKHPYYTAKTLKSAAELPPAVTKLTLRYVRIAGSGLTVTSLQQVN